MTKLLILCIFLFYYGSVLIVAQVDKPKGCQDLHCKRYCKYGFVIPDENGCHNCQCSPCEAGTALTISCEKDESVCEKQGGICRFGENGKKYCCPNRCFETLGNEIKL